MERHLEMTSLLSSWLKFELGSSINPLVCKLHFLLWVRNTTRNNTKKSGCSYGKLPSWWQTDLESFEQTVKSQEIHIWEKVKDSLLLNNPEECFLLSKDVILSWCRSSLFPYQQQRRVHCSGSASPLQGRSLHLQLSSFSLQSSSLLFQRFLRHLHLHQLGPASSKYSSRRFHQTRYLVHWFL